MSSGPRPAPRNWRRRMGTAVLFLIALDALILSGPYGRGREVVALAITIVVGVTILLIWVRNTGLEKAGRHEGKTGRKTASH